MSQSGLIDIEAANPQIPTSFLTDAGSAIAIGNVLEVLGGEGIQTSGAGGTLTVSGIDATSGATALAATKGLASFDSSHFTVTSGFVQLVGGTGVETFLTDDGAPAVEPNATGGLQILGGTGINVKGQGPGNLITVSGEDATTVNEGIIYLSTDAQAISGTLVDNYAINPSSLKAKLGAQTDHGLILGTGTGTALAALNPGTTGQLLVSTTFADPSWSATSYGDFSFSNITAVATPRMLTVVNVDVNAASHADFRLTTPPLGGDALVSWEVQGSHFFAAGVDNQVAGDPWKLSNSSHPSTGTAAITVDATTAAVTFASAYEFPIADGNANEILITDGADNLDWGTVSSLITDLDNILYVGKHGNDTNNGKTASNAKLTIQAAVTAAVAGDTIKVFPGTYTETVTHACSNVTVIAVGKPTNVIITQADANVVDFATFTGIQYKYFGISCTAATSALCTVQGSTGGATFKECQLEMTCAANIAAVTQPSVGCLTGAGTLKVTIGKVTYAHTGDGGGTANKGAFKTADGGVITLQRINDLDVSCSGTALVTSVGVDTSSTGVFEMNDNKMTVTDPNALIVAGFVYLGGTGITHEFFRNTLHVTATNNAGFGFWSADTASKSRFFYNHIHVTDTAGTSNSFLIGNTATVISQFDDIVAADGISLTAGGTFTCTSSETDGDLTCRGREAAGVVQANIMNMDNTATASSAALNLSVGGTTSTGDPFVHWEIPGGSEYSFGPDNSVANDPLKITDGATPSAGNVIWEMTGFEGRSDVYQQSFVTRATISGGTVDLSCLNTSNDAGSHCYVRSLIQSGGLGDPYFTAQVIDGFDWVFGQANALANQFTLGHGGSPSSAINYWQCSTAGEVTMPYQPAFLATHTADQLNGTGDSTALTLNFTTEIFDQNADYDGTNTFTAPVTGRYVLSSTNVATDLGAAHTASNYVLVTTHRNYQFICNPGVTRTVGNANSFSIDSLCDMDATDTVFVRVNVNNSTKTVDFLADGTGSFFSGKLEC